VRPKGCNSIHTSCSYAPLPCGASCLALSVNLHLLASTPSKLKAPAPRLTVVFAILVLVVILHDFFVVYRSGWRSSGRRRMRTPATTPPSRGPAPRRRRRRSARPSWPPSVSAPSCRCSGSVQPATAGVLSGCARRPLSTSARLASICMLACPLLPARGCSYTPVDCC
jgi:hypothetical protein